MRLSTAVSALLFLGTQATKPIEERSYGTCGAADQCLTQAGCRSLHSGQHCCKPTRGGHHICGQGKQCCGSGCCQEGWTCDKHNMCHPPRVPPVPSRCITTVITVVKTVPVAPTKDHGASSAGNSYGAGEAPTTTQKSHLTKFTTVSETTAVIISISGKQTYTLPISSHRSSTSKKPSSTSIPYQIPGSLTRSGGNNGSGYSTIAPTATLHTSSGTRSSVSTGGLSGTSHFGQPSSIQSNRTSHTSGQGSTKPTSWASVITTSRSNSNFNTATLSLTHTGKTLTDTSTNSAPGQSSSGLDDNNPPTATRTNGEFTTAIVTTNSNGQVSTIISVGTGSSGDSSTMLSTGQSGSSQIIIITTNSNGEVSTIVPSGTGGFTETNISDQSSSGTVSSSNSAGPPGQTGSDTQGTLTSSPTAIISTNSDGQVTTIVPTQTNSADQNSSGSASTTAPGTLIVTTNSDGQVTTFTPSETLIPGQSSSGSDSTNIGTAIVSTNPNGQITTIMPSGTNTLDQSLSTSAPLGSSSSETLIVTTNSDGQITTIVPPGTNSAGQGSSISETTSISTAEVPIVITNSDGQVTTILPSGPTSISGASTTSSETPIIITNSDGQSTTINPPGSDSSGSSTGNIPSLTTSGGGDTLSSLPGSPSSTQSLFPSVTTFPDGQVSTFPPIGQGPSTTAPPTSTSTEYGFIVPVTTPIPSPKPTDDGYIIPCSLWFWISCIKWNDLDIYGWRVVLPPGPVPPGPPPTIHPVDGVTITISGPEIDWPKYNIGPDHKPSFPPEPDSCETHTAEMCITSTSYGVSISATSTTTTTTDVISTCATVYGCKVEDTATTQTTASTETPTGTPFPHVVYPADSANGNQVTALGEELKTLVSDPSQIYTSTKGSLGTLFFRLSITTSEADELSRRSDVASVLEACDNKDFPCFDPTIEFVYQEEPPPHLRYISWPRTDPQLALASLNDQYTFDSTAGQDVDVWVIDSGVASNHPEFDLVRDKIQWLTPLADCDGQTRQDDSFSDTTNQQKPKAHGTAMLSLITGKTAGVSKHVTPHIVRLPRKVATGGYWSPEDFLETFAEAANAMPTASNGGTAGVMLMAMYYPRSRFFRLRGKHAKRDINPGDYTYDGSTGFANLLGKMIDQVTSKGYLVVTGSGNSGAPKIDGWPANFGASGDQNKAGVIVVGGVGSGQTDPVNRVFGNVDSGKGLPHIYAPGNKTMVAEGNEYLWAQGGYYKEGQGTSNAAALTAGLAAYFVKLAQTGDLTNSNGDKISNTPQAIKDFIISLGWSRGKMSLPTVQGSGTGYVQGDAIGIFNNMDMSKDSCKWNGNNGCEATSSTSAVVSTTSAATTEAPTTEAPTSIPPDVPSTTETVPEVTTAALTLRDLECNKESDFPGHADIQESSIETTAFLICDLRWGPTDQTDPDILTMGPDSAYREYYQVAEHEIYYKYSAYWLPNCAVEGGTQDVWQPLGKDGESCQDMWHLEIWKKCINGGVGGRITAGCIRFGLDAGVGKPTSSK